MSDDIDYGGGSDGRRRFLSKLGVVGAATVTGLSESATGESADATDDDGGGGSGGDADGSSGGVRAYEDVTYATREAGEMKLDLYVPDASGPAPLVVYVHGGGWIAGTRKNAPDLRRYAAEWGYAMASVSYRLSEIPEGTDPVYAPAPDNTTPRGTFPDNIADVMASIRWLRARADEYGYDADRVALWGASAGGHLAALAATLDCVEDIEGDVLPEGAVEKAVAPDRSSEVSAVVDWYGVTDVAPLAGQVVTLMLGGPVSENPGEARRASPLTYVNADDPPFLVTHGRQDQVVPIRQSRRLYDALKEVEVDATLYELHDYGHVFGADSERTAMDRLTATPRPAQSVSATAHVARGSGTDPVVPSKPPAGPDAIERFLDRNLRTSERGTER